MLTLSLVALDKSVDTTYVKTKLYLSEHPRITKDVEKILLITSDHNCCLGFEDSEKCADVAVV